MILSPLRSEHPMPQGDRNRAMADKLEYKQRMPIKIRSTGKSAYRARPRPAHLRLKRNRPRCFSVDFSSTLVFDNDICDNGVSSLNSIIVCCLIGFCHVGIRDVRYYNIRCGHFRFVQCKYCAHAGSRNNYTCLRTKK